MPNLLGLVAEQVNDLTYVQPEQISPAPVYTAEAPYSVRSSGPIRGSSSSSQLTGSGRCSPRHTFRSDLESPPGFSNEESLHRNSAIGNREIHNRRSSS